MTRMIELLVSLAIVAALFLAVAMILPSSRHLEDSVETNRRLTIVYDTLNSLRRWSHWNPVAAKDPNIQIKLSGPEEGVGARLDYSSQEGGVGVGSWEIVANEPGKRIAYAMTSDDRGVNKRTEFFLTPTGRGGRNVEITQSYDVDYGWNLLGRYAGMYVRSSVGEDMKLGLARLTNMLAAVPNYDYAALSKTDPSMVPTVSERPAENLLVVTAAVDRNNEVVQRTMLNNMQWIDKVMAANNLEAAGPVRMITNEFGRETYSFDVAQPVRKRAAGSSTAGAAVEGEVVAAAPVASDAKIDVKVEGPVVAEYTEASRVVVVPFKGHMANLPMARDSLRAWALTRGFETVGRPYEAWNAGISTGFTENGEYNVYWIVK